MLDRPHRTALCMLSLPLSLLVLTGDAASAQPAPDPQAQSADAPDLSRRELRRLQKSAESALASRDLDAAISSFETVVAATAAGDRRRGSALYSLAMARLLRSSGEDDRSRAAAALRELARSSPGHERGLEIDVVLAQLGATAEEPSENDDFQGTEPPPADAAEDDGAPSDAAEKLRAEVRRLRARIAELEAELEKKDEALRKVKETLVGG